jgi:hypothetical protein
LAQERYHAKPALVCDLGISVQRELICGKGLRLR